MQKLKTIRSEVAPTITTAIALALLISAMLTIAVPSAQATPALAKGQPCAVCHEGKPPKKANLNDKGKAVQSQMKK